MCSGPGRWSQQDPTLPCRGVGRSADRLLLLSEGEWGAEEFEGEDWEWMLLQEASAQAREGEEMRRTKTRPSAEESRTSRESCGHCGGNTAGGEEGE